MGLDLSGDVINGMPYATYKFNSDNQALWPCELVELAMAVEAKVPSRVAVVTPGGVGVALTADAVLLLAFGALLGSREEKVGYLKVVSGSCNARARAQAGDPVFELSGSVGQKIQFLRNVLIGMPHDLRPPITIEYLGHSVLVESALELEHVCAGVRLCRKP